MNDLCEVNAASYTINVILQISKGKVTGTKVYSNNVVKGSVKGISNIELCNDK